VKRKFGTAVVTLSIGRKSRAIGKLTHPFMQRYADKIRSDFIVIDRHMVASRQAKFEKLQIYDLLGRYDRILYLDTDILVMPDCPDIFRMVPVKKFGAFFDSEVKDNDADIPAWRDEEIKYFQRKYGDINWRLVYFNTGVMVISKAHREIMNHHRPFHRGKRFIDQTQINYNFQKSGAPSFDLGPKFNYLLALNGSRRQFEARFENHILHYAGFEQFYKSASLLNRIKSDVAQLKLP